MYTDAWLDAPHVVCTPPNPEHIVAAGILAAALGERNAATQRHRPAPVRVASPLGETADLLRSWRAARRRPCLWVVALDAATVAELGGPAAMARLTAAGLRVLIGPDEVEPDPVRRVQALLAAGIGVAVDPVAVAVARQASRRTRAVQRALQPVEARPAGPTALSDLRHAIALAAALPTAQVRAMAEAWNSGGPAWEAVRGLLAITDERWHSPFIAALHAIDANPAEGLWLVQVVGFSATTQRLRAQARAAVEARRTGRGVLLVAHDHAEAVRLAAVIAAVADGGDGSVPDALPEPAWWQPGRARPRDIALVAVDDEAAAYRCAATTDAAIVDVPPLDERSMDLPHLALAELRRLHRAAARPGAPRTGVDQPEQLAWMSQRWWAGTAELRTWLATHLARDPGGSWLHDGRDVPTHPGLDAGAALGDHLTLDTATAQVVRWALGAHSQQQAALARLGVGTSRLPACVTASHDQPRRLLRRDDRWLDRWATGSGT